MFLAPLHSLADIWDVGKNRLFVAFSETLRRWDNVALGAAGQHIRMRFVQDFEEAFEEFVILNSDS